MKIDFNKKLFDTEFFEENLLPQHSTFKTLDEKGKDDEVSLNGIWKGIYLPEFKQDMLKHLLPEADISALDDIEVPLSLEIQGYGKNQYSNVQYPFDGWNKGDNGKEIEIKNPVCLYLKDLTVKKVNPNKKYIINFKGFETGLFLFVNNQYVGYSENLYLDSEFDISKYLVNGKNRIGALVFKLSTSSWMLDQDFFRFHGIFRDVSFYERSINHVDDIDFTYDLDVENKSAKVKVLLKGNHQGVEKVVRLSTLRGKVLLEDATIEDCVEDEVKDLKLWHPETPNLYKLEVILLNKGKVVETNVLNVGFKEVKIEDRVFKINGKRFVVYGVNRHEWNKERGRNVLPSDMEFDAKFFKNRNINAVRTCHYPDHPYFYELTDKHGIAVLDEACLETHGTLIDMPLRGRLKDPVPSCKDEWVNICVNKVLRMYERDKNHASIIIYSLGNESGGGSVFVKMKEALLARNPKLIIHYENEYLEPEYRVSDFWSSMYTTPSDMEERLRKDKERPLLLCEYAHAMGNSCGNVDEYMALVDKYPNYVGGFVWDYIDQGLEAVNETGKKELSYGGDFFDHPNDKNFCCNGMINADRKEAYKSAKALAFKYYYQPYDFKIEYDSLTIRNKKHFTDSSDVTFVISVLINGIVSKSIKKEVVVEPESSRTIALSLKPKLNDEDEVVYRVEAVLNNSTSAIAKGEIIATEDKVIHERQKAKINRRVKLEVIPGVSNMAVKGDKFAYLFSFLKASHGDPGLCEIIVNGDEYLADELRPTIFRPNTDNDVGNAFAYKNNMAYAASKLFNYKAEDVSFTYLDNGVKITYKYLLDGAEKNVIYVSYHVLEDGSIKVTQSAENLTIVSSLPIFGICLPLPKRLKDFEYYGLGPCENYVDRKAGALLGRYQSNSEDEYKNSNYIRPQECSNHCDTREITILNEHSKLKIEYVDKPFSFKYLPYTEFEIENANHVYELPKSYRNTLTIAGFTRGVGGDTSWGRPVHKQYELPAKKKYEFSFIIRPEVK